jgi:hypothetical protein
VGHDRPGLLAQMAIGLADQCHARLICLHTLDRATSESR